MELLGVIRSRLSQFRPIFNFIVSWLLRKRTNICLSLFFRKLLLVTKCLTTHHLKLLSKQKKSCPFDIYWWITTFTVCKQNLIVIIALNLSIEFKILLQFCRKSFFSFLIEISHGGRDTIAIYDNNDIFPSNLFSQLVPGPLGSLTGQKILYPLFVNSKSALFSQFWEFYIQPYKTDWVSN